jgi:hypothetical protein
MNRKRHLGIVLVALLAAMPRLAAAAEICAKDDNVGGCWDRIHATFVSAPEAETKPAAVTASMAAEQKAEVADEPAGEDTGGSSLQSTTKDFLPWMALSGLLGGKIGDGDGTKESQDIVLDLNFLLPGGGKGRDLQLQAVLESEPTLAGAVRDALPEDSRDELAGKLEKGLSNDDDVTISAAYNVQGLNHGRSFEIYRQRYRALVQPLVLRRVGEQAANDAKLGAMADAVKCLGPDAPDDLEEATFAAIEERCGAEQAVLARQQVAAAAVAFNEPIQALREDLSSDHLDRFADLVANQPQFHVTAQRHERTPLIGGKGWSGKLTYEWAYTNLKRSMSEECHRQLEQDKLTVDDAFVTDCRRQYSDFVAANEESIKDGERFSLTVEYESSAAVTVPLSTLLADAHLADLDVPSSHKRIFNLGWSRNVALQNQPMRMDLVASYEDVSDDPALQDRFVATATLNFKAGELDVPLGIVYANHGKYLKDVDHEISAHLGLKFSLDDLSGGGG